MGPGAAPETAAKLAAGAADTHVAERAARAREVLARAELRTGARSLVPALGQPVAVVVGEPKQEAGPGPARPHRAPPSVMADLERPPLPVPDALAALFDAGLRRGSTVAVQGSTSLALALLAPVSAAGSWAGIVGQPAVGLLAAVQAGIGLDRLALVPRPGPDAPGVLAALLDGVDIVLVGPQAALTDADRRRLTARARERGSVLVSTVAWPGAHVVLAATGQAWAGPGAGDGRLRTHRIQVTRSGRGAAGQLRSVDVTFPLATSTAAAVPNERRTALRLVG